MTQLDVLCSETRKQPQNARDFSAESNPIAEGQKRKEKRKERDRERKQTFSFFFTADLWIF